MPTYSFINTKTKEEFTDFMSMSEKDKYLKKNKHIKQILKAINIVEQEVQILELMADGKKYNQKSQKEILVHLSPRDTVERQLKILKQDKY